MHGGRPVLTEKFLAGRRRSRLSLDEIRALENAIAQVKLVEARQVIARIGERLTQSTYLVEGFASRFIDGPDGGRQSVGLYVPGDFIDLHSFPVDQIDHNIMTLTRARVATVPHDALRTIMAEMPHLACMLWFSTLADAAMHREWIMCLGQMSALARLAHLLCELNIRLRLVGLSDGERYDLPLTQQDLADAAGLTPVHVNRMIRELRESGLAEFRQGKVRILDWKRLQSVADFDPAYLYADDDRSVPSWSKRAAAGNG